jgi:hypothetical protein
LTTNHAQEIEEAIERLQERDEYKHLTTPEADLTADRLGDLIARIEELSDEDVELLYASAPEAPEVSQAQLEREVEQALLGLRMSRHVQAPLEQLRNRQGISVGDLVDALIDRLHLDRGKRRKLRRYYEELEAGLINPAGVSRRVWEVLADRLQERLEDLLALPRPDPVVARYAARPRSRRAVRRSPLTSTPSGSDQWDEIDELFRGQERG